MVKIASNALPWLLLSALIIAADQWTKALVLQALRWQEPAIVIPKFLNWTLTCNYGAAFSFLSEASGWQRWFFSALALTVSTVLLLWLRRVSRHDWRQALPFALVIGGALGNLIDRLRFGYVIDFIDVYWRDWHWPAFNVADSAISAGAVLLIVSALLSSKAKT